MTQEELWELFPIFLVEPNEKWTEYYKEIDVIIKKALDSFPVDRISHIGSTAIKGIWAKNIIDVLVEISEQADMEKAAQAMERNGFIRMSSDDSGISLNRGYTKDGFAEKVYHIHLRYTGDNDELYFRDYLNEHPEIAREYEKLKLMLWKEYEHNRDAYTDAKGEFISKWTVEARREYGDRYRIIDEPTTMIKALSQIELEDSLDLQAFPAFERQR